MNTQNRTADGRIATKKEAQRADCKEMIARYKADAKVALQAGNRALAQRLVTACCELRTAWMSDYNEAV